MSCGERRRCGGWGRGEVEQVSVRMLIGEYPRLGYFFSIGAGRGHAGRLRLANLLATNGRG